MKGEEKRQEQSSCQQLRNQQEWEIFRWLMKQEEMKQFQKLKRFWEAKHKSHFWICGLKEGQRGVQLQKIHIISFTLDAYGTEQKAKPFANYFLERLTLVILQHSHLPRLL